MIAHVTIDPVNAWDASTASISGARDAYGDAQTSGIFLYGGASKASVVYRCAIRRVTDGIMPDVRTGYTQPVHMWGNYIETRWLSYDKEQTDGTHNDAVQIAGGDGATIVGNTLLNPTGGVTDPGSGLMIRGQCLVLTPYHDPQISGVYIYQNWLSGAYTQIAMWPRWDGEATGSTRLRLGGPALPNVRVVGNRFGGKCVWPILGTPAQSTATAQIGSNVAATGGLIWNSGTITQGNPVNMTVAANTGGTGL